MPSTDTVTAKLTPGEFVIKKSAVDILGVPLLRKLNNMPDEGGHDNIDKLLSMAALEGAKPMMGGGLTTPNGVMGYQNGGMMAPDATSADMMNMLYQQSLPQTFDHGSLQDQDRIDRQNQEIMDMVTGSAGAVGAIAKNFGKGLDIEKIKRMLKRLPKKDTKEPKKLWRTQKEREALASKDAYEDLMTHELAEKLTSKQYGGMIGYQEGDVVQDDAMMQQFLQQQQMMQQPQQQGQQQPQQGGNGFVPFDQRQPGAAASGRWGEPGAYMNSLKATRDNLQQAAEQAKLDSARQSLEAIKLDSLIQSLGKEGELIEQRPEPFGIYEQPQSPSEDSETRNRDEYMKQQMMQRFFEQNR